MAVVRRSDEAFFASAESRLQLAKIQGQPLGAFCVKHLLAANGGAVVE